jgi:hypothetical protein
MAEQIGVYRCAGMSLASRGFAVQRVGVYAGHHGKHQLAPDSVVLSPQKVAQHPDFSKWRGEMPLVDSMHQRQIR